MTRRHRQFRFTISHPHPTPSHPATGSGHVLPPYWDSASALSERTNATDGRTSCPHVQQTERKKLFTQPAIAVLLSSFRVATRYSPFTQISRSVDRSCSDCEPASIPLSVRSQSVGRSQSLPPAFGSAHVELSEQEKSITSQTYEAAACRPTQRRQGDVMGLPARELGWTKTKSTALPSIISTKVT